MKDFSALFVNACGVKFAVKTASGEFSATLAELHDVWWTSIARAMA